MLNHQALSAFYPLHSSLFLCHLYSPLNFFDSNIDAAALSCFFFLIADLFSNFSAGKLLGFPMSSVQTFHNILTVLHRAFSEGVDTIWSWLLRCPHSHITNFPASSSALYRFHKCHKYTLIDSVDSRLAFIPSNGWYVLIWHLFVNYLLNTITHWWVKPNIFLAM